MGMLDFKQGRATMETAESPGFNSQCAGWDAADVCAAASLFVNAVNLAIPSLPGLSITWPNHGTDHGPIPSYYTDALPIEQVAGIEWGNDGKLLEKIMLFNGSTSEIRIVGISDDTRQNFSMEVFARENKA
jgi:hypothetical protein